jgi:hypothetical protein
MSKAWLLGAGLTEVESKNQATKTVPIEATSENNPQTRIQPCLNGGLNKPYFKWDDANAIFAKWLISTCVFTDHELSRFEQINPIAIE